MITAGVDIGSTTVKCAVVKDGKMIAWHLMPGGPLPQEVAKQVFEEALKKAGISRSDIAVIATTGYGRRLVDFGDIADLDGGLWGGCGRVGHGSTLW